MASPWIPDRSSASGLPDIVFVVGGIDVQRETTPAHLAALRRFARLGSVLGSLCTGTYALARAGLLAGYACAIHWENMSALKEEFPETRFLKELFVIDRDRVTCTGGVAPLDMMLNLIATRVGSAKVTQIAEQFIVEHVRPIPVRSNACRWSRGWARRTSRCSK